MRLIIDALLRTLTDAERLGSAPPGFTFEAADDGAIRDGEYGDPTRNPRPAWMRDQEVGWEPIQK
jgi:hypothetical protein